MYEPGNSENTSQVKNTKSRQKLWDEGTMKPPPYSEIEQSSGGLSEDDLLCSCCYEILLDPTTLTCGHTFCRYCLAKWWQTSRKTICPECRQHWHGSPKINFTLRNTIEHLFPDAIRGRKESQSLLPNYSNVIWEFDRHGERSSHAFKNTINCGHFCIIASVVVAVIVLIAVGIKALWGTSRNELITKPISAWTPDDVYVWVGEQGPWARGTYDIKFRAAGIDGTLLTKMTEEDLEGPPINMELKLHRRVLLTGIKHLSLRGVKTPSDFWEYKASNGAMSMFLLFGFKEFPRSTMVYLYLFRYQDIFLPFLHRVYETYDKETLSTDGTITPVHPSSWEQRYYFVSRMMITPYYLLGRFAYDYLNINYWTSRVVIIHALLMTLSELTHARWLFTGGYKTLPRMALKYAIFVIGSVLFQKLIWPFIPFFICDCVFYWMLYASPFDALNRLCRRLNVNREVVGDPGRWFNFRFQVRAG